MCYHVFIRFYQFMIVAANYCTSLALLSLPPGLWGYYPHQAVERLGLWFLPFWFCSPKCHESFWSSISEWIHSVMLLGDVWLIGILGWTEEGRATQRTLRWRLCADDDAWLIASARLQYSQWIHWQLLESMHMYPYVTVNVFVKLLHVLGEIEYIYIYI